MFYVTLLIPCTIALSLISPLNSLQRSSRKGKWAKALTQEIQSFFHFYPSKITTPRLRALNLLAFCTLKHLTPSR